MGITLDQKSLKIAFEGRPDLQTAIQNAAAGDAYIELFNQISLHVANLTSSSSSEPASKKRRLDDGPSNGTNGHSAPSSAAAASGKDPVLLEIKDISVVIPQRKKYTLCFTASHLYARLPDSSEPAAGISFAWKDIEYAFRLPVPEKTQKQHNYVLFPRGSNITPSKPSSPIPDPIVFTIPDTAPKPGTISGKDAATASSVSDDYKTLFDWAITSQLKAAGNTVKITLADEKLFASEQRQAHRPSEKAVFVKAFRGSKDGYLFFLPNGILWAFKKPLQFIPHGNITAVSYLNVLQRTFNLNVEIGLEGDEVEEFEFAMLDQEDFGGIDGYVKRHGLMDKSMAEQRKAKRLNVNVVKDEEGNVVGNAEGGELEKAAAEAEQVAVDEEDEEEEDYDPGSEGESEGWGVVMMMTAMLKVVVETRKRKMMKMRLRTSYEL
ncbi:Histone chaperone [Lachnellula suecica]|uniref:Histone chaperone n=1 Tax=Lachnellula suecica TaxID=602035 RepID=A0A8T9C9L6_9HELO|nr:Histone chaperone [Lachnellula suecica]